MSNFFPFDEQKGYREIVKIGDVTRYTGFSLLTLEQGESFRGETGGKETVLIILSGSCNVRAGEEFFEDLGKRENVFSGKATAVYVPINSNYEIQEIAGKKLEIAVVSALAEKQYAPFVIRPEDVVVNHRGTAGYQREVHDIVVENAEGKVDRIVVGETFSYPGQWSSYPSHKHDKFDPPVETEMEEIYHFKVFPKEGFGVQVIYNDELSLREAYMVKDGDTVVINEGYHPVAAAPGFKVYYLWLMAGPYGRKLTPKDDPKLVSALKNSN
ncbi:5-deoxy-glucuronate isomerase [Thermosediminibacter litoriperuensis]|uniref:5-deoxyglucuronate isomerase n=1 Tax=Thermosediminibacter litoriperuensis TaxID=291989 RepID=A0A5S5AR06_9FIRM|nr:5-deoxy-glucuronate isomerase [Thermosediminibacter litoriperuensis]TYP53245.1 5-deoxyglucuronate isomerase [Thermosediminibacter litoriperuensis]